MSLTRAVKRVWNKVRDKKGFDPLDDVLFTWGGTRFRLRDLYQSVLILGAAGSGKTSGSGRFFFNKILALPGSGGLIIASKPEDRADVIAAMKRAGRLDDLIIISPDQKNTCNFLDALGGDPNNLTNGLETMAELMNKTKGESREPFWDRSRKTTFYNAVVVLQIANEPINAANIRKFIVDSASAPEQLITDGFKGGYHNQIMERAFKADKTLIQKFDFEQAVDYWLKEWPRMDSKPRSSIQADCMGVLQPMNSGIVRWLIGNDTTTRPGDILKGKVWFSDLPLQVHGESGRCVGGALKYLVQRMILARHAQGDDGPIFVWIDECHNYLTSYDAMTLAEQRSHRGVAVYLTQSIHSFYKEIGEHPTDALLTNYATKIFHQLGDAKSAQYASSLLGDKLDLTTSGNPEYSDNPFSAPTWKTNYSEHYLPVLQPSAFMGGLRLSGGVVDAVVIRPEPFNSTGERFAIISFNQGA